MKQKINIAIDGYSSCGKSTIAKQSATSLNYIFIDSGAMYRAVTYYFLQHDVELENPKAVDETLQQITLDFKADGNENQVLYLNNQALNQELRDMSVSRVVSKVASLSPVRRFLVQQQQEISTQKGVVMDGRDIGTVVMPNAELKIFVTADKETRIERRYNELIVQGNSITREEVKQNLEHRDYVDTHRKDSPLVKANDALLLDNTHLTMEEQLNWVLEKAQKLINL